jgi:hypothetical protein
LIPLIDREGGRFHVGNNFSGLSFGFLVFAGGFVLFRSAGVVEGTDAAGL